MTRLALGVVLVCVACVRYEPLPLDPGLHPSEARRRDLADSALLASVARYAGEPRGTRWTGRQLAMAALSFRAEPRRLRAEWRAAGAAVRRAGERPPVGAQGDVERRVGGQDEGSPWVVAVGGLFALELGGKRGARLQAARAGVALAESRLLAGTWRVAADARRSAAELAHAAADVEDGRREIRMLEQVHELERARFEEAALGASELARTSTEIQALRLSLAEAEGGVLEARAALAAALAMPVRALEEIEPVLDRPVTCSSLDAANTDSLVVGAMGRHHEVSRALGEYALAESRLRLQIGRQYPDLELGPGFIWDEGVNRWTFAFALPALLGSRNRGAIREAQAARQTAALAVAEVQDSVLADLELAVQRCRGARLALAAADSVVAAAARIVARDRAAYQRGETSRLEPARTELQLHRAERARRRAERRVALASIELELAAGGPPPQENDWPDPRQGREEEANRP